MAVYRGLAVPQGQWAVELTLQRGGEGAKPWAKPWYEAGNGSSAAPLLSHAPS